MNEPRIGVIIVSAGESQRMCGLDKIFTPVLGKPILSYSISAFSMFSIITEIVIVLSKSNLNQGKQLLENGNWGGGVTLCIGGANRQESVRLGLENLSDCDWIIVHDGARPCITSEIISRGIDTARETGAAIAAVPTKDTIKIVDASGVVIATPKRKQLWNVQTPQIFRSDLLRKAHETNLGKDATDDSALVENLGVDVKIFLGSYDNIKLTTLADLNIVELILSGKTSS